MSGRGRNRGGPRFYGGHDDRTENSYGPSRRNRGKLYKAPRGRGKNFGGPNPRSRLVDADDDAAMGDHNMSAGPSFRHNPYGRRNNYQKRGRGNNRRFQQSSGPGGRYPRSSQNSWYKVTIPHGNKMEKELLLQQITQHCAMPFIPLHFATEGTAASFYVQDREASNAIRAVSRRITMPGGFKMIIIVKDSAPPQTPINEETVAKLKVCMSNRYDPAAKSLNLSNLYHDEDMKKEGLQISLAKYQIMLIIIKIIEENIPEIEALDVSRSMLYSLENLQHMIKKAPNIKRLNIGNNKLKDERELSKLSTWPLTELNLDGNPICDRFKDKKQYISFVRKIFPKVTHLDGNELPPVIKFDVDETTKLPPSQGSYFLNDQCKAVILKFLEQYIMLYDSNDRQKLLEAYHDQAIFSMSCYTQNTLKGQRSHVKDYIRESRNLKRMNDSSYREKLLKVGRLNLVAMLNDLPATQHDPASFTVDVHHAADQMLSFTVQGVFRERESKQDPQPVRGFSRMFVLVPKGNGVVVVNEELSLVNATADQIKNSFKSPAPTPSSSPVLTTPSAEQQQQLVQDFSSQSGMTLDWSSQCLIQNEWDFGKSARVFAELKAQGKIPEEAFKK